MNRQVQRVIEKGNTRAAEKLLVVAFNDEHKNAWNKAKQEEYEQAVPQMRDANEAEKKEQYEAYATTVPDDTTLVTEEDYEYKQVSTINDEGYISYNEWINQTKVVKEAVVDDNGTVIEPEVTELVHQYVPLTAEEVDKKVKAYGPLQELKQRLAEEKYQKQADALVQGYSKFEVESFGVQEAEAKAYKADNSSETPLIDAIVANRGIDKDELVNKILTKAAAFKSKIGALLGAKQKELG